MNFFETPPKQRIEQKSEEQEQKDSVREVFADLLGRPYNFQNYKIPRLRVPKLKPKLPVNIESNCKYFEYLFDLDIDTTHGINCEYVFNYIMKWAYGLDLNNIRSKELFNDTDYFDDIYTQSLNQNNKKSVDLQAGDVILFSPIINGSTDYNEEFYHVCVVTRTDKANNTCYVTHYSKTKQITESELLAVLNTRVSRRVNESVTKPYKYNLVKIKRLKPL